MLLGEYGTAAEANERSTNTAPPDLDRAAVEKHINELFDFVSTSDEKAARLPSASEPNSEAAAPPPYNDDEEVQN
jgi:hypothetical protein